jgi:hypothetical protein
MDKRNIRKNASLRGKKIDIHLWIPIYLHKNIIEQAKKEGKSVTAQTVDIIRDYYQQKGLHHAETKD